jgi:hypothetical protein
MSQTQEIQRAKEAQKGGRWTMGKVYLQKAKKIDGHERRRDHQGWFHFLK